MVKLSSTCLIIGQGKLTCKNQASNIGDKRGRNVQYIAYIAVDRVLTPLFLEKFETNWLNNYPYHSISNFKQK